MKLYSYTKAISAAIQFANKDCSESINSEVYGSLFSEFPMGYNFEIMVKSEATHKEAIQQVCTQLHDKYDHSLINELGEFENKVPTFEVVAAEIYKQAKNKINAPNLSITFKVDDCNWVNVKDDSLVQITKSYKINCVHRHHNSDLSMNENKELYGKCSAIHGHEYTVEVSLGGPLNKYGQVISPDELDSIINNKLIKPYHKTYLNDKMGNTSGELISELFYKDLVGALPGELEFSLTLRETRKNSFVKLG